MTTRFIKYLAVGVVLAACDSPLDTNPTTAIDAETALRTPAAVRQALNGAYRGLSSGSLFARNILVFPDLYADNLAFTGTFQTDRDYSLRVVPASNSSNRGIWSASYVVINRANNILEAVEEIDAMTAAERDQARGEALFLRGLSYSILAQWFGGVPIVRLPTRGINEEAEADRNTLAEVYAFIAEDLEEAATLLPSTRVNGRATRGAANALLARVYLEAGQYALARDKATAVISSGLYSLPDNYRSIFTTKHSSESIFEVHFTGGEDQNALAFWFFDQTAGGRRGFQPNASLNNAFEVGDERRAASITTQNNRLIGFKYFRIATGDDNVIVLRLAEMYLIRAEANMRLNAPAATVRADIDVVRARSGLLPLAVTVDTQAELIDAILQERRVEFAMEGHRFFDLRRLGRATTVLNIPPERLLMPIPLDELNVNRNLEQNPGY